MGPHRLIYFRTDGNSQIATGHLMRCLSIAQACQTLSLPVCFLVSDEDSASLLKQFDPAGTFPVKILSSAVYNEMEQELPELLSLLSEAPSLLFIDSYFVTEPYLQAFAGVCPVAYLDDLQLFDYPVDLVINYDVIPEDMLPSYQAAYTKADQTLLGASYTPLRRQFQMDVPAVRPSVKDILITTGGSDPYHFCLNLLSCFQERLSSLLAEPDFHLHILIGSLSKDRELLQELAKELPFLMLHENVSDMATLMASCDLAVSAAGTTLYELCAAGIPAISYTFADNQLPSSLAFASAGAVPCAGDLRMHASVSHASSDNADPASRASSGNADSASRASSGNADSALRASSGNADSPFHTGKPSASSDSTHKASGSAGFSMDFNDTDNAPGLPDVFSTVCEFVTDMSDNIVKRKSAQQSMHRLVDGKGAFRIAKALEECSLHPFRSL